MILRGRGVCGWVCAGMRVNGGKRAGIGVKG